MKVAACRRLLASCGERQEAKDAKKDTLKTGLRPSDGFLGVLRALAAPRSHAEA
jgi:hypothetical protein